MTTTHLFVELLVIGIGAFVALFLVLAAVFGWSHGMLPDLMAIQTVFPMLAVVYVLGIVVDRLADRWFDKWDIEQRLNVFGTDETVYYKARRTLVMDGENLWRDLEYVRSRMRICRGWALNSLFLAFGLGVYWTSTQGVHYLLSLDAIVAIMMLFALGLGCTWCWYRLNRNEYKKTKRISSWLKEREVDTSRVEWFMDAVFSKIEAEVDRRREGSAEEHVPGDIEKKKEGS